MVKTCVRGRTESCFSVMEGKNTQIISKSILYNGEGMEEGSKFQTIRLKGLIPVIRNNNPEGLDVYPIVEALYADTLIEIF